MADNERDNALEDISSDEESSEAKTKGLSRSMLIKIAIGVVSLLLIAGGAYFFLMSSEEPTQETSDPASSELDPSSTKNSATEQSTLDNSSELAMPSTNNDSQENELLKMREQAVALKEENLRMKEQLMNLEEKDNLAETTQPEVDNVETNTAEVDKKQGAEKTVVVKTAPKPKPETNQYSNLYSRDYAPVRNTPSTPPPEPKWGEFDPLYRGR